MSRVTVTVKDASSLSAQSNVDYTVSPVPGKSLYWDGSNFNDSTKWNVGKTSSYPGTGPINTGDNKLDWISSSNYPVNGVFSADKRADGKWNTDLVTTEFVQNEFELKPNDTVLAQVTLSASTGTWPALWTWGRDLSTGVQSGHGEIDFFEYHGDNPRLLELGNHVRDGFKYVDNIITPGVPFTIRCDIGLTSLDIYVDGTLIWADGKGVPSNWVAWPIVNISVSAGQWHPAPTSTQTHMEFKVTKYQVYR